MQHTLSDIISSRDLSRFGIGSDIFNYIYLKKLSAYIYIYKYLKDIEYNTEVPMDKFRCWLKEYNMVLSQNISFLLGKARQGKLALLFYNIKGLK